MERPAGTFFRSRGFEEMRQMPSLGVLLVTIASFTGAYLIPFAKAPRGAAEPFQGKSAFPVGSLCSNEYSCILNLKKTIMKKTTLGGRAPSLPPPTKVTDPQRFSGSGVASCSWGGALGPHSSEEACNFLET